MSLHQFVRCVPTPLTSRDLVDLIYKHWPHPSKNMSESVQQRLTTEIARLILPHEPSQTLQVLIVSTWKNRRKILNDEKEYALREQRRLQLTNQQEQKLKEIFDNFPRGQQSITTLVTLTGDVRRQLVLKLNMEEGEIRRLWHWHKQSKHFSNFIVQQDKRRHLTNDEELLLERIWQTWPKYQRNFDMNKNYPLIINAYITASEPNIAQTFTHPGLTPNYPSREDVRKLRKYQRYERLNFSTYGNRLCTAVANKLQWLVSYYVKQGDDINKIGGTWWYNNHTPLEIVCGNGDIPIFNYLMLLGADVTIGNPLAIACEKVGKETMIHQLLEKDSSNINKLYGHTQKSTALFNYVDNKFPQTETIELLLRAGADPNIPNSVDNWQDGQKTILMLCCEFGKTDIFKLLLRPLAADRLVADVNAVSQLNWTALHFAVKSGKKYMVKKLLQAFANTNIQNNNGETPLTCALIYNQTNIVEILKKHLLIQWTVETASKSLSNDTTDPDYDPIGPDNGPTDPDYDPLSVPEILKKLLESHCGAITHITIDNKGQRIVVEFESSSSSDTAIELIDVIEDGLTQREVRLGLSQRGIRLKMSPTLADLGRIRLSGNNFATKISLIRHQIQESSSRSSSPSPDKMGHSRECLKFSMDQGDVGICYMVSVITLFRNEFCLLNKLEECLMDAYSTKQPKLPIVDEMVDFLTKDYSGVNFEDQCPTLPKNWQSAVYDVNGDASHNDIINGGNSTILMLYILNTMSHAFSNVFRLDITQLKVSHLFDMERVFEQYYERWIDSSDNVAFIHIDVSKFEGLKLRLSNVFVQFESLCRHDCVRAMLIRIKGDDGHVLAATKCKNDNGSDKILYCNSWGKGCVEAPVLISELLMTNSEFRLMHVQYLLRN